MDYKTYTEAASSAKDAAQTFYKNSASALEKIMLEAIKDAGLEKDDNVIELLDDVLTRIDINIKKEIKKVR